MKQLLQSLKTGKTEIVNIPCPAVKQGELLIRSSSTLVSAGTERMLVEFGQANWLDKARQQPDKVRMVLDKVKTDGLLQAVDAVKNKLDQPLALGYCNVGIVVDAGKSIKTVKVGERVISNGKHAEVVNVPNNLCARVPDAVSDEEAAFTVVAAIALQGIRLIQPTLGETVVVTGLGLIGLIAVQLLRAHGCRVLGLDFDKNKLALAKQFGAEVVDLSAGQDPIEIAQTFSRGRGVDAVLITASTDSNEPVHQAALMCRKRGRIVLVGVTGLELSRADFYEKELTFQVSCSYGPGRYDSNYEEKGQDYPVGFVRWTEQRNFEAVLDMMADGRLDMKPLISHRFNIDDAAQAYALISGESREPSLGILLNYPKDNKEFLTRTVQFAKINTKKSESKVVVSFIGSGNYASAVLIPAFKKSNVQLRSIASSGGVSGFHLGRKHGFEETTTDTQTLFSDAETNLIVITTRHNSHAAFVRQALAAGKHVFVEKPLCLTLEELARIESAACNSDRYLMVGFNRRFSPHVQKIKSLLQPIQSPKSFVMTVNAGALPAGHWAQDNEVGGGRILGEACHFIDLLRYLAGSPITSYSRIEIESTTQDTVSLQLSFADGSIGTIHYFANGHKSFPKERLEIFTAGKVLQLDNFRRLKAWGWPKFQKMNLWRQDKGQNHCVSAFVQAIMKGEPSTIPLDELFEVSRVAIELAQLKR